MTETKMLQRSVEILKTDLENVTGFTIHPLDVKDISIENVTKIVPSSLKTLLNLFCTGSRVLDNKVFSITQDIISLNSNGKKRMPKNIGLAISLKNSVRSKEFVTYMNYLGHCISYDDALRMDTTWASEIIESNEGYSTTPTNVKSGVFTQAASDNSDYGEEISSQHVTNTVVYQYGDLSGSFQHNISEIKSKKINRLSLWRNCKHYQNQSCLRHTQAPTSVSYFPKQNLNGIINQASWILLRITGNTDLVRILKNHIDESYISNNHWKL